MPWADVPVDCAAMGETLVKIGGSRSRIAAVLASEILAVLATSLAVAGFLTLLTSRFGSEMIRAFIMS